MADFKDEIIDTYKLETDPVFKLVEVDANESEYKLQLMNTVLQNGTQYSLSSKASTTEAKNPLNDDKILTASSIKDIYQMIGKSEIVKGFAGAELTNLEEVEEGISIEGTNLSGTLEIDYSGFNRGKYNNIVVETEINANNNIDYSLINRDNATYNPELMSDTLYLDDLVDSTGSLPKTFTFNNDGTKLIVAVANSVICYIYNLSIPYDFSTISYDTSENMGIVGDKIQFDDDGFLFCISTYSSLYQFTLSTAYDLTTKSTSRNSDFSGQGELNTFLFNADGSEIWLGYKNGTTFTRHFLSTAYDVTTRSLDSNYAGFESVTGFIMNNDGTKIYTVYDSELRQYSLSTAYDLTQASLDSNTFILDTSLYYRNSLFLQDDGSTAFIYSYAKYKIEKYKTNTNFDFQEKTINTEISSGTLENGNNIIDLFGINRNTYLNDLIVEYTLTRNSTGDAKPTLKASSFVYTKEYSNKIIKGVESTAIASIAFTVPEYFNELTISLTNVNLTDSLYLNFNSDFNNSYGYTFTNSAITIAKEEKIKLCDIGDLDDAVIEIKVRQIKKSGIKLVSWNTANMEGDCVRGVGAYLNKSNNITEINLTSSSGNFEAGLNYEVKIK